LAPAAISLFSSITVSSRWPLTGLVTLAQAASSAAKTGASNAGRARNINAAPLVR
jgi:hypothetical protein